MPSSNAYCPPYMRGSGLQIPGCGVMCKPVCDVSTVGHRQAAIVPTTATNATPAPLRSEFFQALAICTRVIDSVDPNVNRRLEVHRVTINDIPQDVFNNQATAAANISVLLSDAWAAGDDCCCHPINWGFFAQTNLTQQLQMGLFSRQQAGVNVDWYAWFYGNPFDEAPNGYRCGEPFRHKDRAYTTGRTAA